MSLTKYRDATCQTADSSSMLPHRTAKLLRSALLLSFFMAILCGSARAQAVGYTIDLTGKVYVYPVATSGPVYGSQVAPGTQDILLTTLDLGKNPFGGGIAVGPSPDRVYVSIDTAQPAKTLVLLDVSDISNGNVTIQPLNDAANKLKLSNPGALAISTVAQGANAGKTFAYISTNNGITIVDLNSVQFFGNVTGSSGKVAATADGSQVFIAGAGLWEFDSTSVTDGTVATQIPVTATISGTQESVLAPSDVSTFQYVDHKHRQHTLVGVSDSSVHSDGNFYVFILDRVDATTLSTTAVRIPPSTGFNGATLHPVPVGIALFSVGGIIQAAVRDNGTWATWGILNLDSSPTAAIGPIWVEDPTSFAVTPDGKLIYVTSSGNPGRIQRVQNSSLGPICSDPDAFLCGTLSFDLPTPDQVQTAIGGLAPDSPPVEWFIPAAKNGFDLPATSLPAGSVLSVAGEAIVGSGKPIDLTLSFDRQGGGTSRCAILGQKHAEATCQNTNRGTNGIAGTTTFTSGGVYTITLEADSTDGGGSRTQTVLQKVITVGGNCTLSEDNVSPTDDVVVEQTVNASLACTAPKGDSIDASISWGDGATSASTNGPLTADDATPITLNFSHVYALSREFAIRIATVTDNGAAATATGGSVKVKVRP
jgi:hypothetical protein